MGSGTSTACDISLKTSLSPEQQARFQNSTTIRRILSRPGTVAIVGLSSDPQKASYFVAAYLQKRGWKIIPVSPKPGRILGEESVRDLASIKEPVDVVDIFRPPADVPPIVDQAVAIGAKVVWMQLKLANPAAAERAAAAGLTVVADRCMKMEHGRHFGGLHTAGMNTGIITARRQPRGV
jgi:predicted CoA-binding protein